VPPDDQNKRSPAAIGYEWVSRVTTVCLEMVLPGIGGQWLDERWGTNFLALLGLVIGVTVGITHLLAMTKQAERSKKEKKSQD